MYAILLLSFGMQQTALFRVKARAHHAGKKATQRDIWYRLQHNSEFGSCQDVNNAIRDAANVLELAREDLNIICSSRGAISGHLHLQPGLHQAWIDCSSQTYAIPGDCSILSSFAFHTSAW